MYIFYLDESGNHAEATHFILAGLAVFEREIHWFTQDLDALQRDYFPEERNPVYFHAARLNVRAGESVEAPWNRLTEAKRRELKARIYEIIRSRAGVSRLAKWSKKLLPPLEEKTHTSGPLRTYSAGSTCL
jgi:hypothetical protein